MLVKGIIYEDIVNYKKCSLFIIYPWCDFKCDKENGTQLCQNWSLSKQKPQNVNIEHLVQNYIENPLTHAIVCGGLEPFKSFNDLLSLLKEYRKYTDDDFVIYTGYYKDEIINEIEQLKQYKNVIIKFGRFRPSQEPHYDEVLGVPLVNDEQYAEKIS